jgi:anti-sigma regulatory factor (Ser/Thr protein kinase)
MKKKFQRKIDSLENIFKFAAKFINQNQLSEDTAFSINLVIEELFTNMVKYHPGNSNDILISITKDSNKLIISLTDYDVEPFDITDTKDVNPNQSLEERRIGGLGLYFVMKMMDNVNYDYKDGQSKITLIKQLRES